MKTASADLLEFEALKMLLARFIASPLGRAELDRVEPGSDRDVLVATLAGLGPALHAIGLRIPDAIAYE